MVSKKFLSKLESDDAVIPGLGAGDNEKKFLTLVKGKKSKELLTSILLMPLLSFFYTANILYNFKQSWVVMNVKIFEIQF